MLRHLPLILLVIQYILVQHKLVNPILILIQEIIQPRQTLRVRRLMLNLLLRLRKISRQELLHPPRLRQLFLLQIGQRKSIISVRAPLELHQLNPFSATDEILPVLDHARVFVQVGESFVGFGARG